MLACRPVGSRVDLKRKSVARILDEANPLPDNIVH
jgi:hypothetical protein